MTDFGEPRPPFLISKAMSQLLSEQESMLAAAQENFSTGHRELCVTYLEALERTLVGAWPACSVLDP
jgi:hypothetical protein